MGFFFVRTTDPMLREAPSMLGREKDDRSGPSDCRSSFRSIARDSMARPLPHRFFRPREVMSSIDQRDVGERLGEITDQSLGPRIIFFGQKPHIVPQRK
jgi:hypothetical protein